MLHTSYLSQCSRADLIDIDCTSAYHRVNRTTEVLFMAKNVLGDTLQTCSQQPLTGFYRDGCCNTGPEDAGRHIVCAVVTPDFLEFSRSRGNDLVTPAPQYGFPGLKPGDRWCLCVDRWVEAFQAGKAPWIVLRATHESVREVIPVEILNQYAYEARLN